MENNQPQSQPVEQAPTQAASPAVPVQPKSRFKLLFVALVILGVLFLGGTYFLVASQKKTATSAPIMNKNVETQTSIHKLDEEVQSLDTDNVESDFTQVDQELKNL